MIRILPIYSGSKIVTAARIRKRFIKFSTVKLHRDPMCRIAVIGGSIAGLLTSYYLNRFCDVHIYEAADRVGLRGRRCTGLVSVETSNRMPNSRKFVENSYKKITIFLGNGLSLTITSKKPFAVKLNRELYELELSSILESQGAEIRLSSRVTQVVPKPQLEVVVKTKSYSEEYDGAVLAEGYPPTVTENIAPNISIRRVMVAVQQKFRVQGLRELDRSEEHTSELQSLG